MRGKPAVIESTEPGDLDQVDVDGARSRQLPLVGDRVADGPIKRYRCLTLDEVDACRRLDCDHYDACLALVVLERWPGWACPSRCASYRETRLEILVATPDQALVCLHTSAVVLLS